MRVQLHSVITMNLVRNVTAEFDKFVLNGHVLWLFPEKNALRLKYAPSCTVLVKSPGGLFKRLARRTEGEQKNNLLLPSAIQVSWSITHTDHTASLLTHMLSHRDFIWCSFLLSSAVSPVSIGYCGRAWMHIIRGFYFKKNFILQASYTTRYFWVKVFVFKSIKIAEIISSQYWRDTDFVLWFPSENFKIFLSN